MNINKYTSYLQNEWESGTDTIVPTTSFVETARRTRRLMQQEWSHALSQNKYIIQYEYIQGLGNCSQTHTANASERNVEKCSQEAIRPDNNIHVLTAPC